MVARSTTNKIFKTRHTPRVFVMALWFLILVQLILLIIGCADSPSATFKNPQFRCPSPDVVEPDAGFPRPVQQYPLESEQKSVSELKDFCARMKQRFANSNMTVKEAEAFYALLKENNDKSFPDGNRLTFRNGSYGMPGPKPRKPFIFEEQVRLKKITSEKYEIFYYTIGCGVNYIHEEVHLERSKITQVLTAEIWREAYPC